MRSKINQKRIALMLILALFVSCIQPVGAMAQEGSEVEADAVSTNAIPVQKVLQPNDSVYVAEQDYSYYYDEEEDLDLYIAHYQLQTEKAGTYSFSEGYDSYVSVYKEGAAYGESDKKVSSLVYLPDSYTDKDYVGYRMYQLEAGKTYEVFVGAVDYREEYQLSVERKVKKVVYDKDEIDAFVASGGMISVVSSADFNDIYDYSDDEISSQYVRLSDGNYLILDANGFAAKYQKDKWVPGFSSYVWCNLDEDTNRNVCDQLEDRRYGYYNGRTDEFEVMLPVNYYAQNGKQLVMDELINPDENIILVTYVPAVVFVQKITLTGKTVLKPGEKDTIRATIDTLNKYAASNPNVLFSSSDPSVLKVSAKGEIEGVKAGVADVICKSADGNASQKLTVTVKEEQKPVTPAPAPKPEKKGTTITAGKGMGKFKVTNASSSNPTVEYVGPTAAGKKKKSVTIPEYITYNGVKYRVTSVAAKSFRNNKKLTNVKIASGITLIGKSAFEGCTKLKTVTLGKSLTTIGKNAFKNCKSLKTITLKSTKLKTADKSAFKGVNKKCVIKVPKKMLARYKKLFRKKGIKLKLKAI